MTKLHIVRCGNGFAVLGKDGTCHSTHLTFEPASTALETLEKAERERLTNDPKAQAKRLQRAMYREANTPGTTLYALKRIFPRKGDIARATEKSYWSSAIFTGIDFDSVKKFTQRQARLRAVNTAAALHVKKGADTREQVAKLWNALSNTPPRERASLIALQLRIEARHVRRLCSSMKLK